MIEPRKKIGTCLSFGGGIQSTTIALMSASGFLPRLDCAIFADTKWEPQEVYDNLEWTIGEIKKSKNPFPVIVTDNNRSLKEDVKNIVNETDDPYMIAPVFQESGMGHRQCTTKYKINPIKKAVVKFFNPKRSEYVEQWIGISMDEFQRMKAEKVQYMRNFWPLIDLKFSRKDCAEWLSSNYPDAKVSKSSCIGCPFHGINQWKEISQKYPIEFQEVVEMEKNYQVYARENGYSKPYFNSKKIPLDLLVKIAEEDDSDQDQGCIGNCFT